MNTSYTPAEIKIAVERFTGHTNVRVTFESHTLKVITPNEQLLWVTVERFPTKVWYLKEVYGRVQNTGLDWERLVATLRDQ